MLCAVERRWRDTLPIFAVGVAAAVSLLPYIPLIIRAKDWYDHAQAWFSFFARMEAALCGDRFPADGFHVGLGCTMDRRTRSGNFRAFLAPRSSSRACPGPDSICGHQPRSWGGRLRFLSKAIGSPTQPWNYVPLMAFSVVCLDTIFLAAWRWARPAAMILAALTISTAFLFELPAVKCRQTNVDLIAASLSSEVAPNDYVIVHPFYCGVTFQRYYKATAPWTTLPPLEDYTLQRYDLLKAKMQTKDPIAPVIDRITSTLQSGNRVWLVGNIPFTQEPLPEIRPAPNNPWGWFDGLTRSTGVSRSLNSFQLIASAPLWRSLLPRIASIHLRTCRLSW